MPYKARPLDPNWVLDIRDQCEQAKVAFFFKQWGGVRKKAAGRMLEGRTYDDYPRIVTNPIQPKKWRLEMIEELAA